LVAEAAANTDQVICTTHSADIARVFDATSVLIVVNDAGSLAARPLLKSDLPHGASNNERKLYLQNRARVVSALMHPIVLVPEGRFDTEWLARLAAVADPHTTSTTPFSAVFGVVPTENAAVVFTTQKLAPLHRRIAAIVDGDGPGDACLAALTRVTPSPFLVIQLPAGWTIEDVVVWMLEASAATTAASLATALPGFAILSLDILRGLLKTCNDKSKNVVGLKEDVLAHDEICGVLEATPACLVRTVTFCEALVSAAQGKNHPNIVADESRSSAVVRVVRFKP
jgi:hypothetical protein